MTAIPLHFELPENLTATKFLDKLSKKIDFQIASQHYTIKSFYDSFDWRLYNADIVCEFNHSQVASQLTLQNRKSGECLAVEDIQDIPAFTELFPQGRLKSELENKLEMRALLPICHLPYEAYRINILNKDLKTVLRIQIDQYEFLSNTVNLIPLKGYEKAVRNITNLLQKNFNLKPADNTVLNLALKQQGQKVKDYSSKLEIKLKPDMRADKACKTIYQHLLHTMKANEAGTIADTDSEFLHDFRVAVRRTRSGFNQIKHTLPPHIIAQHADFFAWLGQITSLTRDLDVYLLSFKDYQQALPISLRADIIPLYDFLKQKQVLAQEELATKLKSPHYIKQLTAWELYLNEPLPKKPKENNAHLSIKELADQRIWKVYKRLLKEAGDISEASPAKALHDLRKTCKKLRYLMEFFQNLYPASEIKILLKALKGFQNILGDFQDYEIQEIQIKQFSQEMMDNKVPSDTFLAMGVLVQYLDSMKCVARKGFSAQFTTFKRAENQAIFKKLFTSKSGSQSV